jgi:hypothetical protein
MLQYELTSRYKGFGLSLNLDRGLLVLHDGVLLVEEGMGIGACALQIGGYTYFASTRSIGDTDDSLALAFSLDRRLEWRLMGIKSRIFTRALEFVVTHSYMKREKSQNMLLKLGNFLGKLFFVTPDYVFVPSKGEMMISYTASQDAIDVEVSYKAPKAGGVLFIMNELGGNIFNEGIINGVQTPPPTGWKKVTGTCELFSQSHALAFTIDERHVPENVQSTIYWGRESCANNCWAGFESKLISPSGEFDHYRYAIMFREAVK